MITGFCVDHVMVVATASSPWDRNAFSVGVSSVWESVRLGASQHQGRRADEDRLRVHSRYEVLVQLLQCRIRGRALTFDIIAPKNQHTRPVVQEVSHARHQRSLPLPSGLHPLQLHLVGIRLPRRGPPFLPKGTWIGALWSQAIPRQRAFTPKL